MFSKKNYYPYHSNMYMMSMKTTALLSVRNLYAQKELKPSLLRMFNWCNNIIAGIMLSFTCSNCKSFTESHKRVCDLLAIFRPILLTYMYTNKSFVDVQLIYAGNNFPQIWFSNFNRWINISMKFCTLLWKKTASRKIFLYSNHMHSKLRCDTRKIIPPLWHVIHYLNEGLEM